MAHALLDIFLTSGPCPFFQLETLAFFDFENHSVILLTMRHSFTVTFITDILNYTLFSGPLKSNLKHTQI